jgi:hypothetical protein
MKTKGVLIIALGHANYFRMAFNLAMSIKVSNKETPIALVHSSGMVDNINYFEKKYFDHLIELKESEYTINGKREIPLVKTMAYKLSPFDETIYIDADSVWVKNKKVDNLFNEFQHLDFGFTLYHKEAHYPVDSDNSNFWFKDGETVRDLRKYFDLKKDAYYYHLQSSFLYFKKSKFAEKVFAKAKELFVNRNFEFRDWADSMPDELAFSLSLLTLNYKIENPYKEVFYYPMSEKIDDKGKKIGVKATERSYIEQNYYFISMAGHVMSLPLKQLYNDHVKWNFAQRQNLKYPFLWIDKKDYLKERNKY